MSGVTDFRRLINATRYSVAGLRAAFVNEAAFRQEVILAVVMIPAAFFVGRGALQVGLLIAVVLLALVVELLNSAVEAVVDRIGEERHELAGRAKDLGSAAVMLTLILVATVWAGVILNNW